MKKTRVRKNPKECILELQKGVEVSKIFDSFENLNHNLSEVYKYGEIRSDLAEEQANSMKKHLGIDPELHVQYHEVTIAAKASLRNYYVGIKTFLNALVIVFVAKLPKEFARGLKNNSVDRFLKTFEQKITPLEESEYKELLKSTYKSFCEVYDIAEYRNKEIEHPQLNSEVGFIDGFGGITPKIMKVKYDSEPKSKSKRKKVQNQNINEPHINALLFSRENKYKDVLVHVIPYEFKEGEVIKAGDPLLEYGETWKEHFKEYGEHSHLFPDINRIKDTYELPFENKIEVLATSPEVVDSVKKVLNLIKLVYKSIKSSK